jgi:hypothetical protein
LDHCSRAITRNTDITVAIDLVTIGIVIAVDTGCISSEKSRNNIASESTTCLYLIVQCTLFSFQ